jgi:hypothetical protein
MRPHTAVLAAVLSAAVSPCFADVVIDVHAIAVRTARSAGMPASVAANHYTAASLAMFEAANAIEGHYRAYGSTPPAPANGNVDAATLGAGCAALAVSFASQAAAVTSACDDLAKGMPATETVRASRAYGEAVGKAVVASRQAIAKAVVNTYRPRASPGVYVPTPLPIGFDFANGIPFALTSPSQFRPGPPPKLDSDAWTRDYNEIKTLGGRNSTARTPEQTATALFWASAGPAQYVDSVASLPFRGTTADRARLLALFYIAISDVSYAVFDAKYAYDFWRPITAIRNGDEDGNHATERDPGWTPLVDTPPHQEYPCAHCATAAAIITVLTAAGNPGQPIVVQSADPNGKPRSFAQANDAVLEVANARVWSGVHYRNSTDVGIALGRAVGKFIVDNKLQPVN